MGRPKASVAKLNYHVKQLRKMFARSDDHSFLQMIWAVDAIQDDRADAAKPFLNFPPEAADSSIGGPFAIHRWELETLLTQLFLTPKQTIRPGKNLILDTSNFDTMRETVNRLRALENVESGVQLAREDYTIFDEMHRIAQRQFNWQRGYFNLPQLYRYSYLYGQGQCGDYLRAQHGLAVTELNLVGFGLYIGYQQRPWQTQQNLNAPELGLTAEVVEKAMPFLALTAAETRTRTETVVREAEEAHGSALPTAYLPSIFRQFPLVSTDEDHTNFIAPMPELLLVRVTSGLYYDIISGGQALLNEANDRFEQYCVDYIAAMAPRFEVKRSFRYGPKGAQVDTPDVLVSDGGKIVVVAECKATKLTYLAQFAEDPFDAQKRQYEQLARAVVQLWRFFSHVRRAIMNEEVAADADGMVFTLDTYLYMGRPLREKVFKLAHDLANKDKDILQEDRRDIIFCPAQDLETLLSRGTEDTFLACLKAAQTEKYEGWQLRQIHQDSQKETESKKFPFKLGEVLPWWKALQEHKERQEQAAPQD